MAKSDGLLTDADIAMELKLRTEACQGEFTVQDASGMVHGSLPPLHELHIEGENELGTTVDQEVQVPISPQQLSQRTARRATTTSTEDALACILFDAISKADGNMLSPQTVLPPRAGPKAPTGASTTKPCKPSLADGEHNGYFNGIELGINIDQVEVHGEHKGLEMALRDPGVDLRAYLDTAAQAAWDASIHNVMQLSPGTLAGLSVNDEVEEGCEDRQPLIRQLFM